MQSRLLRCSGRRCSFRLQKGQTRQRAWPCTVVRHPSTIAFLESNGDELERLFRLAGEHGMKDVEQMMYCILDRPGLEAGDALSGFQSWNNVSILLVMFLGHLTLNRNMPWFPSLRKIWNHCKEVVHSYSYGIGPVWILLVLSLFPAFDAQISIHRTRRTRPPHWASRNALIEKHCMRRPLDRSYRSLWEKNVTVMLMRTDSLVLCDTMLTIGEAEYGEDLESM